MLTIMNIDVRVSESLLKVCFGTHLGVELLDPIVILTFLVIIILVDVK